ncbi:helix-turn-helix domain-containing protein [Nocardia asteroides]|nr:helix-turn-helix domain-containing protein [Nocardia asteroides]
MTVEPCVITSGGVVVLTGTAVHDVAHLIGEGIIRRRGTGRAIPARYLQLRDTLTAAAATMARHHDTDPATTPGEGETLDSLTSTAELAETLGCSLRTAQRRAERLGGQKIGGKWIVPKPATPAA